MVRSDITAFDRAQRAELAGDAEQLRDRAIHGER
jgi:hypothetical protein